MMVIPAAAYLLNLLKLMGNEYDCISLSLRCEKAHQTVPGSPGAFSGTAVGSSRMGMWPHEQRLKDLYLLLLSNGQVLHPLVRVT